MFFTSSSKSVIESKPVFWVNSIAKLMIIGESGSVDTRVTGQDYKIADTFIYECAKDVMGKLTFEPKKRRVYNLAGHADQIIHVVLKLLRLSTDCLQFSHSGRQFLSKSSTHAASLLQMSLCKILSVMTNGAMKPIGSNKLFVVDRSPHWGMVYLLAGC